MMRLPPDSLWGGVGPSGYEWFRLSSSVRQQPRNNAPKFKRNDHNFDEQPADKRDKLRQNVRQLMLEFKDTEVSETFKLGNVNVRDLIKRNRDKIVIGRYAQRRFDEINPVKDLEPFQYKESVYGEEAWKCAEAVRFAFKEAGQPVPELFSLVGKKSSLKPKLKGGQPAITEVERSAQYACIKLCVDEGLNPTELLGEVRTHESACSLVAGVAEEVFGHFENWSYSSLRRSWERRRSN